MSTVDCWECGKSYPKDIVFDIPIFNNLDNSKATIRWCFDCANNQLTNSDFIIIKKDIINLLKKYNQKLFDDLKFIISDYRRHLHEYLDVLKKLKVQK